MQVERAGFIQRVADGCVMYGNLPFGLGQPMETLANTGYYPEGESFSPKDEPILD